MFKFKKPGFTFTQSTNDKKMSIPFADIHYMQAQDEKSLTIYYRDKKMIAFLPSKDMRRNVFKNFATTSSTFKVKNYEISPHTMTWTLPAKGVAR